jgi:membrane fusion protein, multidrug efflux system
VVRKVSNNNVESFIEMNIQNRTGAASGVGALIAMSIMLQLVTGCSPKESPRVESVRPVKTMIVAAGDDEHTRVFPGRVGALRNAELTFPVPGVLVSFNVKEGQAVAKGEVIAQLRTNEFSARLATLQGQLDQARAALRSQEAGERPEEQLRRASALRSAEARLSNARIEYERASRMVKTEAISRSEYDQAATLYQVAQEDHKAARQMFEMGTVGREEDVAARQADVRALEGRVTEAKIQLDDCTMRAPFAGVVAQRLVEERQNVRANEPVVRFQDAKELEIAADVPESIMVADIRTADILQMFAEIGGAPGLQFPVTIREISQQADPTTQTFRVRVAMQAPEGLQVLPGMTATVTVIYRRASVLGNPIFVPISSVAKLDTGEQVVWVVSPDQTVTRRPVKLGTTTGSRIQILAGVEPGDRIAVAGARSLREGMKVSDLGNALGGRP